MGTVIGVLVGLVVAAVAFYPFMARPVVRELDDAGSFELRHGWLRAGVGSMDALVGAGLLAAGVIAVVDPSASMRVWILALAVIVWALITWHLVHDTLTWRIRVDREAVCWRTGSDGEGRVALDEVRDVEPVYNWVDSDDATVPRRGTRLTARDGRTVMLPVGTPTELLRERFPRADWSEERGVLGRDGRMRPRRR